MKIKLKPLFEGAKLLAFAYVTVGLLGATIVQGKNTYDATKAALIKPSVES